MLSILLSNFLGDHDINCFDDVQAWLKSFSHLFWISFFSKYNSFCSFFLKKKVILTLSLYLLYLFFLIFKLWICNKHVFFLGKRKEKTVTVLIINLQTWLYCHSPMPHFGLFSFAKQPNQVWICLILTAQNQTWGNLAGHAHCFGQRSFWLILYSWILCF